MTISALSILRLYIIGKKIRFIVRGDEKKSPHWLDEIHISADKEIVDIAVSIKFNRQNVVIDTISGYSVVRDHRQIIDFVDAETIV